MTYWHRWKREVATGTVREPFTVYAAARAGTPWGECINRQCADNAQSTPALAEQKSSRQSSQRARQVALCWTTTVQPDTWMNWALAESTHTQTCSASMSAGGGATLPPTRRRRQRQETWVGRWWSSQQLTRLLGQSGSGRIQMWKSPGGPEHMSPPIKTSPPEWVERWREVVASGLNTSLRLRKWETAACLRTHCISFEEEKMGNVGAVNDLCVICVARLRGCRCACASLCGSKQNKKKKKKFGYLSP